MLRGKNVILRAIEKEDVAKLVRIKNEEEVLIHLRSNIPQPNSVYAGELDYEEKCKKKNENEVEFAIENSEGTIIGKCGTMDTRWKDSETTVFIFIGGSENRGKGYGTEAIKLLMDFVFQQMNIRRVKLYVFSFNVRAKSSYEKAGFKVEGILRQELFRNGKYHDVIQMGILKHEYYALHGGGTEDAV